MPDHQLVTQWGSYFLQGLFRYIRNSFASAGQDSFTDPPAQNPDAFEKLVNVLPPVQGDLDRRWGYTLLNSTLLTGTPSVAKALPEAVYQDDATLARQLVFQNGTTVGATDESGATTNASIFTPTAQTRFLNSRSFGYFTSGNAADYKKWDGGTGLTNWGISISGAGASTFGPNSPSSASGASWANPNNIFVQDAVYATQSIGGSFVTEQQQPTDHTASTTALLGEGYGFALTAGTTVFGVQVKLFFQLVETPNQLPANDVEFKLQLLKNGVVVGTAKIADAFVGGVTTLTFGSSSDLWGTTFQASDVNAATFGVQLIATGDWTIPGSPTHNTIHISSVSVQVDYISITLFTATGQITVATGGAGAITLVSGRIYFVAFVNDGTQGTSDLSAASLSSGAVTSKQLNLSTIPVSNDPQVTGKYLLATSDGGDETTLYLITELANSATTYTDNMADTTLVLQPVYLELDENGNEVGVSNNDPPQTGLTFPTKHRGRIYMASGGQLFYSKSEAELLMSTGQLAGHYEECWPAFNFFDVSADAEAIHGLLSDGQVLYIGTERRIIRLFGDSPLNFIEPQTLFDHVGVLNQDTWKLVFLQGNPLGCMWLAPDKRIIGSDFNSYQDVGTPVQDILDSINISAAVTTAWATYVGISVFNLYVLAVPTGTNTTPDTLLVCDLRTRQWYVWQPTDLIVGGFYNITAAGATQFVVVAANGKIYQFDPSVFQDRTGDTPVNFSVQMRTSWLDMSDSAARKMLNEIEVITADSAMTVTVEGASTKADFSSPHTVISAAPLAVKPLGEFFVPLAGVKSRDRYYRLTFNVSDQATDLLRGYNIQGLVAHRN